MTLLVKTLLSFYLSLCVITVFAKNEITITTETYAKDVISIQEQLYRTLESDISKIQKCETLHTHLHSNAKNFFAITGRIVRLATDMKRISASYNGASEKDAEAKFIWRKLKSATNRNPTSLSLFNLFCLPARDNTTVKDYVPAIGQYRSVVRATDDQVVLHSKLGDDDLFISWKKEGGDWKIFNAIGTNTNERELSKAEKGFAAQTVAIVHTVDALNSQCYRLEHPVLEGNDAKTILMYMFGDIGDDLYVETVKSMRKTIDLTVRDVTKLIEDNGGCEEAYPKVLGMLHTLQLSNKLIQSLTWALLRE